MMKTAIWKVPVIGMLAGVVTLLFGTGVSAHVVVKPAEAVTGGFQTFTMGVPNEKEIPTTEVKLVVPVGLREVSPTQKTGWHIDIGKSSTGEVQSITWSGGVIDTGMRDDFTFSAQVPEKATELQWKAYQTYTDGTVVAWDKAGASDKEGGDSGPFSVTKVVADTAENASIKKANEAAVNANTMASIAVYVGCAGILIGLVGVYFGTREKK